MSQLFYAYNSALRRRSKVAQYSTAAVIFGGGDVFSQQILEQRGTTHDWGRTLRWTFFGGVLFCPPMARCYAFLNQITHRNKTKAVMSRVFLDQAIFTPAAIAFSLGSMSVLEGRSTNQAIKTVQDAYFPTLQRNWNSSIPAQVVNFSLIPPHLRLIAFSIFNLCRVEERRNLHQSENLTDLKRKSVSLVNGSERAEVPTVNTRIPDSCEHTATITRNSLKLHVKELSSAKKSFQKMTAITRNLPWFVRDVGISVIGRECYVSLVENLAIGDTQCIKYALSKGLGIGIVVGGAVMKVPQILLIVNARSARGLSLPAYVLETLSYAITLVYSYRNDFPFSTYGENFFLTIQNTIITFSLLLYTPSSQSSSSSSSISLFTVFMTTTVALLLYIHDDALAFLQVLTLPLSLFSKLPQIRQNARARSTGQLSAIAVFAQIAGCLARLFTTSTEVGDTLVFAGFALALLLNLVLGAQLWMYWGNGAEKVHVGVDNSSDAEYENVPLKEVTDTSGSAYGPELSSFTTPQRMGTPPPRTPSSAGIRKWSRKVD